MSKETNVGFLKRVARGEHQGTDSDGVLWRIVQTTASRWEVYEDATFVFEDPTLTGCKLYLVGELRERADPEHARRMLCLRLRRRERRGESLDWNVFAEGQGYK